MNSETNVVHVNILNPVGDINHPLANEIAYDELVTKVVENDIDQVVTEMRDELHDQCDRLEPNYGTAWTLLSNAIGSVDWWGAIRSTLQDMKDNAEEEEE